MNVKYVEAMVMRSDSVDISIGEVDRAIERLAEELGKDLSSDDEAQRNRAETLLNMLDAIQIAVNDIDLPEPEYLMLEPVGSSETITTQLERAGFLVADEVAIVKLAVLAALIANQSAPVPERDVAGHGRREDQRGGTLMDACEICRHEWHGATRCGERVRITVSGTPVTGFTKSGAGPIDAIALKSRPFSTATPPVTLALTANCACRGLDERNCDREYVTLPANDAQETA